MPVKGTVILTDASSSAGYTSGSATNTDGHVTYDPGADRVYVYKDSETSEVGVGSEYASLCNGISPIDLVVYLDFRNASSIDVVSPYKIDNLANDYTSGLNAVQWRMYTGSDTPGNIYTSSGGGYITPNGSSGFVDPLDTGPGLGGTLIIWASLDTGGGYQSIAGRMRSYGNSTGWPYQDYHWGFKKDGGTIYAAGALNADNNMESGTISDNVWQQYAMIGETAAEGGGIYVGRTTYNSEDLDSGFTSYKWRIGGNRGNQDSGGWDGNYQSGLGLSNDNKIGIVAKWDRILSHGEIQTFYDNVNGSW